jgi:hypothetical protein
MGNLTGTSVRERLSAEIEGLVSEGRELLNHVKEKDVSEVLQIFGRYHAWYTRALGLVKSLVPERLDEFRRQYERNEKRKAIDRVSYVIEDYLNGILAPTTYDLESDDYVPRFSVRTVVFRKMSTQVEIIASSVPRLDDILANIRGVLQADLFDSELDAARHLRDNGHLRAAGAVAGVVLEGHLAQVCSQRSVAIRKKAPHISDFNDALKNAGVFDVVQWRRVQGLADIRNLCDHKKQRDPTQDEVDELISGVDKAIKTLA